MKGTSLKLIGLFVLGGFALVVSALLLFSSRDYLTPKRKFVAYFQKSVNGLNVGAPLKFRGIPVGEVLTIEGVYDPQTGNVIPRVVLELRPETLKNAVVQQDEYTLFPLLVKNGMRASLKTTSLLTGQLYVSLDFHPDKPVRRLGSGRDPYPEMPTLDSGFDEAIEKLSSLPIEEVLARAVGAMSAIEELLRDPDIDRAVASFADLAQDADATIVDVGAFVQTDLRTTLREANATLVAIREAVSSVSKTVNDQTLVQTERTLVEFQRTLAAMQKRLTPSDPLSQELSSALREIAVAARSAKLLMDYLEEHPEALLKGKPAP